MAKVPLRIDAVKGRLAVMDCGRARDFEAWIHENLPAPTDAPLGDVGLRLQRQWWMQNGQHFSIIHERMPVEMRLHILEYAFGEIHPNHDSFFGYGSILGPQNGYVMYDYDPNPTMAHADPPTPGVLLINKQINNELDGLVKRAKKCFQHLDVRLAVRHPSTAGVKHDAFDIAQTLVVVEVEHSNTDFMHMFGVTVATWMNWEEKQPVPGGTAYIFPQLPCLKHLILRFQSPMYASFDDPSGKIWGRDLGVYMRRNLGQVDVRGHHDYTTSCQKTIVDWTLVFAKEVLVQLPKVKITLCGFIKTSTKNKWDTILAEERRGVPYDESPEKQMIMAWDPNDLPPPCYCTTPCEYYRAAVFHREYKPHQPKYMQDMERREKEEAIEKYKFDFDD